MLVCVPPPTLLVGTRRGHLIGLPLAGRREGGVWPFASDSRSRGNLLRANYHQQSEPQENNRSACYSHECWTLKGANASGFYPELPYRWLPTTVYLRDYWQAAGYAEAVEERLRKELQLRSRRQAKDREVLDLIASSRCTILVHVRRGDYLKAKNPMVLPFSCYQQAWNAMLEEFEHAEFFVFSDDIEFARANLPTILNGSRTLPPPICSTRWPTRPRRPTRSMRHPPTRPARISPTRSTTRRSPPTCRSPNKSKVRSTPGAPPRRTPPARVARADRRSRPPR